jgi:ubiquinone/menaquinone biosynthesis C-methylase UbiE
MRRFLVPWTLLFLTILSTAGAQEKSVKPRINDPFKNPDVEKFQKTFEGESQEVFVQREKIVAACEVKPGMVVADIGAGTGLHTRLFARVVENEGQVYAVDIAAKFLEHIRKTSREAGLKNVTAVLCNKDSVDLPPSSVDVAFVCDTYHHFEYPQKTLASLRRALKPGGKLVVVGPNAARAAPAGSRREELTPQPVLLAPVDAADDGHQVGQDDRIAAPHRRRQEQERLLDVRGQVK